MGLLFFFFLKLVITYYVRSVGIFLSFALLIVKTAGRSVCIFYFPFDSFRSFISSTKKTISCSGSDTVKIQKINQLISLYIHIPPVVHVKEVDRERDTICHARQMQLTWQIAEFFHGFASNNQFHRQSMAAVFLFSSGAKQDLQFMYRWYRVDILEIK